MDIPKAIQEAAEPVGRTLPTAPELAVRSIGARSLPREAP